MQSEWRKDARIAILGTGVWGSALATLARNNHYDVRIWSYRGDVALADTVSGANLVVSAVSMQGVDAVAEQLRGLKTALGDSQVLPASVIIVSATKGLDAQTTRTPSQIWQAALPDHPIVVLSGPNLSQEIQQDLPAATVVASEDLAAATRVQEVFSCERFRIYTNRDRLGTELGGTLKNVIAIAVGVCDGLELGTNARSALMTRALPELIRIGTRLGGEAETFFGLSGLGDLLATCTSPLSRNYQVGFQLAQGRSLPEVLADLKTTAEGVNTTNVLIAIAEREKIPVPICWQVYRLLNGQITPQQAVVALMARDLKAETH